MRKNRYYKEENKVLYLRLAIDNIFSQFKRFLLSVLLIVVSLTVIIYVVLIYAGQGYGYSSCDKLLTQGFDKTGVLTLNDISDDVDFEGFWNEAYEREEIYSMGEMEMYDADFSEDILNIQRENSQGEFVTYEDFFSILTVGVRSLRLCDLKLSQGTEPNNLDFSDNTDTNKVTYIYLGSAYKSIPVGTEYRFDAPGYSYVYKVAGILEDGQRWVYPDLYLQIGFEDVDYTIDCTYGVFGIVDLQVPPSDLWISASDGYTIKEAIDAAYEVADKYGIDMTYTTLTDVYETYCSETILLLSYFGDAFAIIIPAIILMLIAMQIVSIMLELNTYGIMCSQGFSLKDINIMLIIKNVIMSLVGLAIAAPVVLWIVSKQYAEAFKMIMDTVMLSTALPTAIIILIAVTLITSLTSVIMLRRYTPVKLMGTRN